MKLLIGVPTAGRVRTETFTGLYQLRIPKKIKTHTLEFTDGYGVAQARNIIAAKALQGGHDYALFVDSDIILPPDALEQLLAQKTDIAAGWYPCLFHDGTQDHSWVKYDAAANAYVCRWAGYGNLEPRAVIDIDACGFGCVLVKTSVFKRLPYPYFKYVEYPNGAVLAEDLYFCDLVRRVLPDVRIRGLRAVKCGHVKQQILL